MNVIQALAGMIGFVSLSQKSKKTVGELEMRSFLLGTFFVLLGLPMLAAAGSVTVNGVTIDYSKATESSPDASQQKFIDAYQAAWGDASSEKMKQLVDSRSLCGGPVTDEEKNFFEMWITAARGMQGHQWPRDAKLRFSWQPWKDADMLMLSKRGLATYPATPNYIVSIAAAEPKAVDSYNGMNFFSVIKADTGELRLAFPCLTEKGIEQRRTELKKQ